MAAEPGPPSPRPPAGPTESWPLPKRTLHPPSRAPSKRVYFEGPYGDELRIHVETLALLNDWTTSDAILYLLKQGVQKRT
jgi:hypothetical protein